MFEFIIIILFVETVVFRLNSTKMIWSNLYQPLVRCSFCHGCWIGLLVGFNMNPHHTMVNIAVGAISCFIYNVLILKEG